MIHVDGSADAVGVGKVPHTDWTLDVAATGSNAIKAAGKIEVTGAISATSSLTGESLIVSGTETVTAAGAISITKAVTLLSVTGTVTFTLANGTTDGQMKTIICHAVGSAPDGTITGTFNGVTSLDIDAVGEAFQLIWANSKWCMLSSGGSTVIGGHN